MYHLPPMRLSLVFAALFTLTTAFAAKAEQRGVIATDRNEKDNTVTSVTFSKEAQLKANDAQSIFINYLGLNTATSKMELKNSITTPDGITTDRYNQFFKGYRIEYGSYTVTSKNNLVSFISGNFYNPAISTSAIAGISEAVALTKALAYMGAEKYMWQDAGADAHLQSVTGNPTASYYPKAELVWVEDFYGQSGDRALHLAYSFDVYAVKPLGRRQIFVDANTGRILYSNSTIKHTSATGRSKYSGTVPFVTARVSSSYRLYDSTRGGGVHTMNMRRGTTYSSATEFTSTSNTWPNSTADTVALDAHWGGEKVYDYLYSQLGRNSWNGTGGILLQYVHYDNAYDNAFWDGTSMNYGDGSGLAAGGFTPLTSLDVTAHEIGHGVCEATANLVYSSESGALNEGFSDCWGAVIENWANPSESDAISKKPWYMGEEIGGGVPLRRMDSPKLFTLPDTYRGTYWYSVTSCTPTAANDECGVHTNMGVLSKWFYLLTIGASGRNDLSNTYSVTGVGWTKSAKILYQTELSLSSTATYATTRTTSIAAATTLYGACSAEVQAVTNAWYAVGVGAAYSGSTYVAAIAGASTVNVGSTITLTDSTTGGTWTSVTPSRATVTSTGVVTGLAAGTDTIKYAVTGTCGTTTVFKVITITTPCSVPVIGAISGGTSVCRTASTTFTDTTVAGTWSSSAATIASVSTAGVVYGVAAGSATITYSKSNACGTGTATKAITVTASTSAGTLSGSTTVCLAGTTTLTSTVTGGTWASSNNTIASVTTAGVVRGNATGSATITYSVIGTCGTATTTATVNVVSAPSAGTVSGTSTVCAGATSTLTSTVTGGTWSSSAATIASVSTTGVVTGASAGSATITYTVSSSCGTATATYAVTVSPAPNAGTLSGTAALCVAGTATFTSTVTGGTWSSSAATIASVTTTGAVRANAAGTATISYSVTNSCGTAVATRVVTASTTPTVAAITGATTVAAGSTITLANTTTGGTWSATNTRASVSATGVVTGSTAGLDTIKYTVTNPCGSAVTSYTVTVTAAAAADIYTYVSSTSGAPSSVNSRITTYTSLTGVGTGTTSGCASGFSGLTGFSATTFATTNPSIQVSLTAATGYTINVTGFTAGLRRSSTGPTKARLAYSINGGTTWVNNGTDFAPLNGSCATSASGTTLASWTGFSVTNPSILLRIYPYAASASTGTLQVYGLSVIGYVNSTTFRKEAGAPVDLFATNEMLAIYPNPNNGMFTIAFPENKDGAVVSITDVNGRSILNQAVNSAERSIELNLSNYPTGTYFVRAIVDGKVYNDKVQVK